MKLNALQITGLIYSLILCVFGYSFLEFDQLELVGNPAFYSEGYSDQDENGKSTVKINQESPLQYQYQINPGIQFPYSGIYFEDTLDKRKIDLSQFDKIDIEISATKGKLIPLTIHTLWNLKSRPFQRVIKTKPELTKYHFKLKEFKTPEWWLSKYNLGEDENQKFKEVLTINIEDSHEIPRGILDEIQIKSILFSKNNTSITIGLSTAWIIGVFILFMIPFFKPEKKLIPIKAVEFNSQKDENEFEKITVFMGDTYINPELNVRMVSKATGLKDTEISKLLQGQFSMNFKEYLNFIRITEAKRLLKNSELQISEIAYAVGYNNVTHFNRVFKASEKVSPNEFRA